jgi:hypothetical protein
MHSQVRRLVDQITERFETAADETVQELASEAASMVKEKTPDNRRKTRQSVRWKMLGPRLAVVGLYFATRYTKNKRAFTYRMFSDMWRQDIRPRLRARLIKKLNNKLQR